MAMFEIRGIPINDPGELLANIPALWRFHPARSLLVLCEQEIDAQTRFTDSARVKLSEWADQEALAGQMLQFAAQADADSVVLALIDDQNKHTVHQPLVDILIQAMDCIDVPVRAALWAHATYEGAPWISYLDQTTGTVIDPATTVLATRTAVDGRVIFGDLDDLVASFAPRATDSVTQRRAWLADAAAAAFMDRRAAMPTRACADALAAVDIALEEASNGNLPSADGHIAYLSVVLADPDVQGCVAVPHEATGHGAEALWTELMREAPPGWRAHPASLLAADAFLRGEGMITAIALSMATSDQPDHALARRIQRALDDATAVDEITTQLTQEAVDLRNQLSRG